MSCDCQKQKYKSAIPPQPPCLPCAIGHLDLAEHADGHGRRHLVVWHLARAAELAPGASRQLRQARIDYQLNGRPLDWHHLRGVIK